MKSMGLRRLFIVGNSMINAPEARRLAVHATDILDNAVHSDSLERAVRGCSFIAGITRRPGQRRKHIYATPRQLAQKLRLLDSEIAIVFGNEVSGLSDDELMKCHAAVMIPSSELCPSLNLSHAVQVIAYEVRATLYEEGNLPTYSAVDDQTLAEVIAGIITSINAIGFHTQDGPQGMGVFLRDILARATLSTTEAERIGALFAKMAGMTTHSCRPSKD